MVCKWVISPTYKLGILGWNNPFTNNLLTSWDIQVRVTWGTLQTPGAFLDHPRIRGYITMVSFRKSARDGVVGPLQNALSWWFKVTFLGWVSDPFKGFSDLQLGDEKVILNHLEMAYKWGVTKHLLIRMILQVGCGGLLSSRYIN